MKRREFITLFGGAAAAWPLPARAQQPERMPRIGVLSNLTEDDPEARARDAAFVQGLRQLDWIAGRNVQIEYRYAAADPARFRSFAAELAGLGPNVVLAYTSPAVAALQQTMPSVPIVFASVIDPVGAGIVETLARPGGNATGFTVFEYGIAGKWLELLKEIAPAVTRAAIIRDPAIPAGIGQFAAIQSVAPSLGIEFSAIGVRDPAEIERGVATFSRSANGGLIVTASVLATAHRFEWTVYRFGIAGISEFEQPYRDAVRPSRRATSAEIIAAAEDSTHSSSNANSLDRRDPNQTELSRYFK